MGSLRRLISHGRERLILSTGAPVVARPGGRRGRVVGEAGWSPRLCGGPPVAKPLASAVQHSRRANSARGRERPVEIRMALMPGGDLFVGVRRSKGDVFRERFGVDHEADG
jgi:hypothetical protein